MTNYSRITTPLRRALNSDVCESFTLTGRSRKTTIGKALTELAEIFSRHGFSLDMVTGDIMLGDSGNRLLPYRVAHEQAFEEHPMIENSRVSFSWYKEGDLVEIVAYVS
jgi:hypothetical protein